MTGGGPRIWPLVIMLLLVSIIPISTSSLSNVLAAVSTAIMSDNTLPTPTTVNPVGNLYNINGGTISGTNQFHSFDVFSVGPGDIASFNGPIGITNILGRVTGLQSGLQVSSIYGTIQSTIPGANLFLINPAGFLFGPGATVNVGGMVHFTTADYLRLDEVGGPNAGIFHWT